MDLDHFTVRMHTRTEWDLRGDGLTAEQTQNEADKYGIPRFAAAVLMSRGCTDIPAFLSKSKRLIRHPDGLPDINDAADRILRAVNNNEKIVVYGDYDVDGMTSTAIMTDFLRRIGADASYYIPDRVTEGYGLNKDAIIKMAEDGVRLIITVDCGVTNIDESRMAFSRNVDIVITDHHSCLDELPFASAVVNPKRPDSGYGYSGLAGVGVAFKVCLALGLRLGIPSGEIFDRYCALAAVGTIADVVPLDDENRVIVAKGLEMIASREFTGIDAILRLIGLEKRAVDSSAVSFGIAPKLNAAGRLGDPRDAVTLLMTKSRAEADMLAHKLNDLNDERRLLENEIFAAIIDDYDKHPFKLSERILIVRGRGWNHGVIGRVAAMVSEKYYKPCIVVSFDGKEGKGSCRSIEGFDMFKALLDSAEYLKEFGGHKAAAGLSMESRSWNKFCSNICRYARRVYKYQSDMVKYIHIDCELLPSEITLSTCAAMSALEPFGTDNPRPVFITYGLKILSISTVGADKNHLRVLFEDDKGAMYSGIGFRMGALEKRFKAGSLVDCVFTLDINNYNGIDSAQMKLLDMVWSREYNNK